MTELHASLVRVKGSVRHQRLSEFLQHSITAAETGESRTARYILLTAMAAFGWPTSFTPLR